VATDFDSAQLGATSDTVRLQLGDEDVLISESYEVKLGVLTQPAAFSLRLGHGSVVRELIEKYPPRKPFKLFVGGALQFRGEIDGYEASGETGATEITIRGRDSLAPLHDAFVTADKSYTDASYLDIFLSQLGEVGFVGKILFTNEANRKAVTGTNTVQTTDPNTQAVATAVTKKVMQAKVGERRYHLCKRQFDRAGLFAWAAASGDAILGEPNTHQRAAYRIVRQRGQDRDAVNAISAKYRNETTPRYSECVIYGRGGGKRFGRQKSKGSFIDTEMTALGYERPLVAKDNNVTTDAQAELYARRVLAESRRAGWSLTYMMAGHTTEAVTGGRAVWAPDTMVEVDDQEFGLKDTYWIESVTHRRGPQTTTEIVLMRKEDLFFAQGDTAT
jgi:prophage tail gpP-like protein